QTRSVMTRSGSLSGATAQHTPRKSAWDSLAASKDSMLKRVADRIRRLARPAPQPEPSPGYTEPEERIYQLAAPYTATDRNRVLALIEAVRYVHRAQVAGVLLECGVLRGGSMMVA